MSLLIETPVRDSRIVFWEGDIPHLCWPKAWPIEINTNDSQNEDLQIR